MNKTRNNESIFVVRIYDDKGTLLPALYAFRSRAGAEACANEWTPKGRKCEVLEVQLDD